MTVTDTSPSHSSSPVEAAAVQIEDVDELEDESWLSSTQPKGIRVRVPLAAMTLALALILGAWGGAALAASNTPAAAAAPVNAPGAGRGGGLGGGANPGGGGGGLSGTVSSVQGNTIKLTTASGATVTIALLPSTAITRTAAATPTDITAGETITVRGQTGADGTTAAQTIAIVPAANTGG
jgi:hypothetical protein